MRLLIALLLVAILIAVGECIQCHQCTGTNCKQLTTCSGASLGYVTVPGATGGYTCQKTIAGGSTVKSCMPKMGTTTNDGCISARGTTVCFCSTDGCNSAFGGKMSLKMMMPFLVVCYFTAKILAM